MTVDLTKVRGAVYALQNEGIKNNPVFTVDYVVRAFTVTHKTLSYEQVDGFYPMNGYTIAQTVAMKIDGAHHPDNLGTRQGATSRYASY